MTVAMLPVEPHVPVWEKSQRTDGSSSSAAFRWDAQRDEYRCPQGHPLRREWRPFTNPRTHITRADSVIYRSRHADCKTCPLKSQCYPSTPFRKITRSIYEAARNVARNIAKSDGYSQSRKDRKKVEKLFARLKRILHLTRLRLRGMNGARDDFLLAAIAQNLRRLAKRWHPPPKYSAILVT
jgi:hypothetical protein